MGVAQEAIERAKKDSTLTQAQRDWMTLGMEIMVEGLSKEAQTHLTVAESMPYTETAIYSNAIYDLCRYLGLEIESQFEYLKRSTEATDA